MSRPTQKQTTARFPGKCPVCGGRWETGQRIVFHRGYGWSHASCPGLSEPNPPRRRVACNHKFSSWEKAGMFDSTLRRTCSRCKKIQTRQPFPAH